MNCDFATVGVERIGSAGQLAERLRDAPGPVRLAGSGSTQNRLPAPQAAAQILSLAPMARLLRFDAGDLTCTAEPGLMRSELDAALAPHRLELACRGEGTLGGIFARGAPPLAPGAPSPRSLLLGLHGVLSDGTQFKAGARVVKNVAGYDLTKLFTGSRGRLFGATALHLKLRVQPRARIAFACDGLDRMAALAQFSALRRAAEPPAALALSVGGAAASVHGLLEGRPEHVRERLVHCGTETELRSFELAPAAGEELLRGCIRPSRLPALLERLPQDARMLVTGSGAFEVALRPHAIDALLAQLPELEAAGELAMAPVSRRGRATPEDPGAQRLTAALRAQLDPRGILQ